MFPSLVTSLAARITALDDEADSVQAAGEAAVSPPIAVPLLSLIARTGLGLLAVQRNDGPGPRSSMRLWGLTEACCFHRPGLPSTAFWTSRPIQWATRTRLRAISRTPWPFAERQATGPSQPGLAATTPTPCSNVTVMGTADTDYSMAVDSSIAVFARDFNLEQPRLSKRSGTQSFKRVGTFSAVTSSYRRRDSSRERRTRDDQETLDCGSGGCRFHYHS